MRHGGWRAQLTPASELARAVVDQRMHNDSSFRSLKVWQIAMTLIEDVYHVTTTFPVQDGILISASPTERRYPLPATPYQLPATRQNTHEPGCGQSICVTPVAGTKCLE
jgi:hypothetical protein